MDAQSRDQKVTAEPRDRFPEPRGWALKWDAFVPFVPVASAPALPTVEVHEPGPTNGVWDKFPEPRGWAANWDGWVLSELDRRQNGRVA